MEVSPNIYPICWLTENGDNFHYDYMVWKKETNSVYYFSKPNASYYEIPENATVIPNLENLPFRLFSRVSNLISKISNYDDIDFDPELCWIKIIE